MTADEIERRYLAAIQELFNLWTAQLYADTAALHARAEQLTQDTLERLGVPDAFRPMFVTQLPATLVQMTTAGIETARALLDASFTVLLANLAACS